MKDLHNYINDYVAGKLEGEDLAAFERALEQDAELRALVANYGAAGKIVDGILEHELTEEIESVRQEYAGKPVATGQEASGTVRRLKSRRWWLAAASVAVLVTATWLTMRILNPGQPELTAQQVYDQFYVDPLWPASRSSSTATFSEKAYSAFVNNDFALARSILLDSISDKAMGRYWLAEMYLKRMEPDSALVYLPRSTSDPLLHERSVYLATVAYLLQGDVKAAQRFDSMSVLNDTPIERYLNQRR